MDPDVEFGGEAFGLGTPVAHDAERAHDKVRAGPLHEVGERRGRLAEPHVVGQAPSEAEPSRAGVHASQFIANCT